MSRAMLVTATLVALFALDTFDYAAFSVVRDRNAGNTPAMKLGAVVAALMLVAGCSKSSSDPPATDQPSREATKEMAKKDEPPPKAEFPKHRWVRTEMFGSKKPYIGFTYIDKTKGPSIKGEDVSGLTAAQIKEKLHAKFPSSTMQPLEDGYPMTLLTDAEIKELELPAEPDWVQYYK